MLVKSAFLVGRRYGARLCSAFIGRRRGLLSLDLDSWLGVVVVVVSSGSPGRDASRPLPAAIEHRSRQLAVLWARVCTGTEWRAWPQLPPCPKPPTVHLDGCARCSLSLTGQSTQLKFSSRSCASSARVRTRLVAPRARARKRKNAISEAHRTLRVDASRQWASIGRSRLIGSPGAISEPRGVAAREEPLDAQDQESGHLIALP